MPPRVHFTVLNRHYLLVTINIPGILPSVGVLAVRYQEMCHPLLGTSTITTLGHYTGHLKMKMVSYQWSMVNCVYLSVNSQVYQ